MLEVKFNRAFDTAIKQTEVVVQRVKEYSFKLTNEEVLGTTRVKVAEVQSDVLISEAKALAKSIEYIKEAEADALQTSIEKEVKAMEYIQDTLKSNQDAGHLMTFVWLRLMEAKVDDGTDVHVMMNNPLFSQ